MSRDPMTDEEKERMLEVDRRIQEDVEENPELYQALAGDPDESPYWVDEE